MLRQVMACLLLFVVAPSFAATLEFSADNDFFTGHDRYYTNGLRLSWLSSPHADNGCDFGWLCALPGSGAPDHRQAWSVTLQQLMVTPNNTHRREANFNDVPYVGFTHVSVGYLDWDDRVLTSYGLRIGTTGNRSGAADGQRAVHKLIGSHHPKGWKHQLGPTTIVGVYALQSRTLWLQHRQNAHDWSSHLMYGVDLNNFLAAARIGWFMSYGHNDEIRFLPDSTGLATAASMVSHPRDTAADGWSVFGGIVGEYIGYNYLTQHDHRYRVTRRHGVINGLLGVSRHWPSGWQLAFSLRQSSSLVRERSVPLSFGNLTVSRTF